MDRKKTHTFEDLKTGKFTGTSLAVIGYPIKHSISPAMHNAALAKLSETDERFKDWAYYRFDIHPEQLAEALPLFHRQNFHGLNLTIPHKVQALNLIEQISEEAQLMGAVNTLLRNETHYSGLNTDGYGLERGLELDLEIAFEGTTVMLLGAGGAARAAAVRALLSGCAQLYIGNRSPDRLQSLVKALEPISDGIDLRTFNLNQPPRNLTKSGVVINATALGLKPDDPAPINVAQLPIHWKAYDMVYNPSKTVLLKQAEMHGMEVANGLSMLVYQGARALETWTQKTVDADTMMMAASAALNL